VRAPVKGKRLNTAEKINATFSNGEKGRSRGFPMEGDRGNSEERGCKFQTRGGGNSPPAFLKQKKEGLEKEKGGVGPKGGRKGKRRGGSRVPLGGKGSQ